MGLGYSRNDKDTEIQNLKYQLEEKTNLVTILESELNAIKNMDNDKSLNPTIIREINKAQTKHDYEYLVFSGGAIKGISFTGALMELESRGIIYDESGKFKLKGIATVSVGSIVGSLLAVGYKANELYRIATNLKFEKIFDDKIGYIRDTINFLKDWGVCPGEYIQKFLGELIAQKTGNPDYTLEQLQADKGIKLVIVSTDMCSKKTIYLYAGNPIKEFSNIPIRKAVRMSLGIPFAFEPYNYNDCVLVDGGVLDNYPLHVFDGDFPGDPKARLNLCPANPKVLGLKIMTSDGTLDYDLVNKQKFNNLFDYSYSFVDTFLTENERRIMTPSFWLRTIIIVTPNYPLIKTSITDNERNKLIETGKKYVVDFFTNSKSRNYVNFKPRLIDL